MRRHYLDNIRTIAILLLFPYHTFMIWNNFGMKFYIWGGDNNIISSLIVLAGPSFMPVLFVIAGMSARYSMIKRSTKEFIKDRVNKILIPFVYGMILLIPFQTLYARKFFFKYDRGISENFKYFFTHVSDLSGYDGMFTFGHLWFLLYLFVIAFISLLVIKKMPFEKVQSKINKVNIFEMILLFVPIFVSYHIGNFSGQSVGKYLLLYFIGYYLFSDENIDKIINKKGLVLSLFAVSQITLVVLYFKLGCYDDLLVSFAGWLGVLSCIIVGKLFLNRENKITNYFKKSSFPIYILHQTILVIVAYYTLIMINNIVLQMFAIIFGSFIITILFYEIISKIPILKKVIGVR